MLGVSRKTLYDILDEKQPVTPVMALRFGKLCDGPDLWLNLQQRYDLQSRRAGTQRKDQCHSDIPIESGYPAYRPLAGC